MTAPGAKATGRVRIVVFLLAWMAWEKSPWRSRIGRVASANTTKAGRKAGQRVGPVALYKYLRVTSALHFPVHPNPIVRFSQGLAEGDLESRAGQGRLTKSGQGGCRGGPSRRVTFAQLGKLPRLRGIRRDQQIIYHTRYQTGRQQWRPSAPLSSP